MEAPCEIVIERVMNAPVRSVWRAWLDRDRIAKWWGPAGFRSTVRTLDVRAGGRFEVVMHGPDGTDYPNVYLFDEVEEARRLVYTNIGSREFGLAPFQSTFVMEGIGETTRAVLTARFSSREDRRRHVEDFHAIEGAEQLLGRLEGEARLGPE